MKTLIAIGAVALLATASACKAGEAPLIKVEPNAIIAGFPKDDWTIPNAAIRKILAAGKTCDSIHWAVPGNYAGFKIGCNHGEWDYRYIVDGDSVEHE